MPYRDPEGKREWELRHRAERLARRRELRRIEAAQPTQPKVDTDGAGVLLIPLLAGGAVLRNYCAQFWSLTDLRDKPSA